MSKIPQRPTGLKVYFDSLIPKETVGDILKTSTKTLDTGTNQKNTKYTDTNLQLKRQKAWDISCFQSGA